MDVWTQRRLVRALCDMHKCIMVKVGEKLKTQKACKKHVNLTKSEGNL